jgi:DUF1365 family protein
MIEEMRVGGMAKSSLQFLAVRVELTIKWRGIKLIMRSIHRMDFTNQDAPGMNL